MMIKYDKLVRDRIPEIIEKSGGTCTTRTCREGEFMERLVEKLEEEVAEFRRNSSLEELADIFEVFHALIDELGGSAEEVERIRREKLDKRGAFSRRILLIEASDPSTRPKSPK